MHTHRQNVLRDAVFSALAILAAAIAWHLATAPDAQAHQPDCRTIAIRQALADPRPATPHLVASYRTACIARARAHQRLHRIQHATRRCMRVPGTIAGSRACHAVATAAVDRDHDRWAWSPALHSLLRKESSWNPNAVNDASHACGLFQRLVKPKLAADGKGCPWPTSGVGTKRERVHTTALVQAKDGVRYVAGRYGSPEAAWAFWLAHGWY